MKKRLDIHSFDLPVDKIKSGFYTDKYFLRTADILNADNKNPQVLMQVFQRDSVCLCGIEESIAILKRCAHNPSSLKIHALYDGDHIQPWETVMTIEGRYQDFVHLETIYLGALARQTKIATNVDACVRAAQNKPVLFFSSRYDHYSVQERDGYAAYVAGVTAVSTDANGAYVNLKGVGTIPHALIATYNKNTLAATEAFDKYSPEDIKRVALVDFDNDCVQTSLKVARHFGKKLFGVRLDTSGNMVDKSVLNHMGMFNPTGVCPQLVHNVRQALDQEGFQAVKIMVSGGFNAETITKFEQAHVPVDTYAIGSSFFDGNINFTADIVLVDGQPASKQGRKFLPNPRLELV